MLWIQQPEKDQIESSYILTEKIAGHIKSEVRASLTDAGIPTDQRREIEKDLIFLRAIRRMRESAGRIIWGIFVAGTATGTASILALGLRQYLNE